ncbi:MAG: Uma2 family endonuclease [Polyangiaceae bacterium]|nr:Uma2 family endonuclease [Polyangiaceae bacterium]
MVQPIPSPLWVVSLDDPRAPPTDVWNAMSDAERQAVLDALPSEFPAVEAHPPEGDFHDEEGSRLKRGLRRVFGSGPRQVYVAGDLPVYYPGEAMFSPDLIAVVGVSPHFRKGWVKDAEGGRGLDFALELIWSGSRRKDLADNVTKYARLRIPEYFVFDMPRRLLLGYRLQEGAAEYTPLEPRAGVLELATLGLGLMVEGEKLRFLAATAPIPDPDELIARLERTTDGSLARIRELEAALDAEQKAREAEQKAREAEHKARERAEAKLRELGIDPDQL